jgi:hypothetical protein
VVTIRRTAAFLLARSKWLVVGLCGFEMAAITTRKVPTLTQLSERHKALGPVLVIALAVHLFRRPRVTAQLECELCCDIGD